MMHSTRVAIKPMPSGPKTTSDPRVNSCIKHTHTHNTVHDDPCTAIPQSPSQSHDSFAQSHNPTIPTLGCSGREYGENERPVLIFDHADVNPTPQQNPTHFSHPFPPPPLFLIITIASNTSLYCIQWLLLLLLRIWTWNRPSLLFWLTCSTTTTTEKSLFSLTSLPLSLPARVLFLSA